MVARQHTEQEFGPFCLLHLPDLAVVLLVEFLFEFLRPCVERMLAPEYRRFIDSRHFAAMVKDLETEDAFEWILARR